MCSNESEADITFSTAHKAKGLEFDTVKIAGFSDHDSDLEEMNEDEKNILYVAVSRCVAHLVHWSFFCICFPLFLLYSFFSPLVPFS